jgi:hypothetical protein
MSKIHISPNALGTGSVTIASPNTNSDYEMTLPGYAGELLATFGGANGAVILPQGTTAQRPILVAGKRAVRFNTDLSEYERGEGTGNTWERMDGLLTGPVISVAGMTSVDFEFPLWAQTMTLTCLSFGMSVLGSLVHRAVHSGGETNSGYLATSDYGTGVTTATSGWQSYIAGTAPSRAFTGQLVFSRIGSSIVHAGNGLCAATISSQSAGQVSPINPMLFLRTYPSSGGTLSGWVRITYST